jgi:RNA polymerase sigma factor (sigma-70 family)
MEVPLKKVRKILQLTREPLSLDIFIGDDKDTKLINLIEDETISTPEDIAISFNLSDGMDKALATLKPKEEKVLRLRFRKDIEYHYGLANRRYTLEEISKLLNVTKERIRQIETKALLKLRHPSRRPLIESLLDYPEEYDQLMKLGDKPKTEPKLGEDMTQFVTLCQKLLTELEYTILSFRPSFKKQIKVCLPWNAIGTKKSIRLLNNGNVLNEAEIIDVALTAKEKILQSGILQKLLPELPKRFKLFFSDGSIAKKKEELSL